MISWERRRFGSSPSLSLSKRVKSFLSLSKKALTFPDLHAGEIGDRRERMCKCNHKNNHPPTIPDIEGASMISKESTTVVSLRPARKKTRTKTRKPKFLSLRLELSSDNSQESGDTTTPNHQLNLFPLHPENLVEDKDMHDENNMAYFFAASDGGATLNGLLGDDADEGAAASVPSEEDPLSPSLTYAYNSEEGASTLERTALRNRERDAGEEKWVCYSEVVEKKEEEVTSSAADPWCKTAHTQRRLSLKLDYQEILNAWSGKGTLYLEAESPQTVPDIANVTGDGWSGVWRVPEMGGGRGTCSTKMEDVGGGEGGNKREQRQASVLRYKEKRQSRLFSKRIRYEVRKLNAEKRPRMKGRFVKRS